MYIHANVGLWWWDVGLCHCVQKLSIYGDGDLLSTLDDEDTLIDIKPRAQLFVAAPLPAKHALWRAQNLPLVVILPTCSNIISLVFCLIYFTCCEPTNLTVGTGCCWGNGICMVVGVNTLLVYGLTVSIYICAPCGLRGYKNWPAPFPGQMSYKATKPGLISVLYLSMRSTVLLFIRAPFMYR